MKSIDEDTINNIKQSNDIVDVISNYVSLVKKGKNYMCICPFHDDTNPSMVISQEKQIYKCFSCGAGGNVITFVQNFEKISFVEALVILANKAGIELNYENNAKVKQDNNNFQEFYKINDEAKTLYEYLLTETNDKIVLDYLNNRNLNKEIISKFNIGYGGNTNVLSNLIKSKNIDINNAVEIGLLHLNNNELNDVYKNRLIYPIIDQYNNVVGFTARAIGNLTPKYINSIESKAFNKSSVLYNINNAIDSIKKSKSVYLLEGPNDVIAFYKAGYENAVCIMGTALTKEHIKILKTNKVNQVIIAFDGDDAGRNATHKAIEILINSKFNVKYINFDKYDPDEYLMINGFQKFKELVNKPNSALEFMIDFEYAKINTNNYADKKDIVIKIVNKLNNILDDFDKEYYYNYLSNLSGISYEVISSYATKKINTGNVNIKRKVNVDLSENTELDNASINILYFIMNDRKYFEIFNKEIGSFINSKYRKLANVVSAFYLTNHNFDISKLDDLTTDIEVLEELAKILLSYDYDKYHNEMIFTDSIETLKFESLYLKIEKLKEEMNKIENPLDKIDISTEIIEISQQISQVKVKKFNK